jgi:hypothetical protein
MRRVTLAILATASSDMVPPAASMAAAAFTIRARVRAASLARRGLQ